jgi:chromate transport protein ChrA
MAEINLIALVVNIIVNVIVLSPVLWIAGRLLAGKDKAKFTDALWIVVLGTVIGAVFQAFLEGILGLLGSIIMLIIWLALVKHFFDTGWLKALVIAILAIIIYIIIVAILVLLGLAIIAGSSLLI